MKQRFGQLLAQSVQVVRIATMLDQRLSLPPTKKVVDLVSPAAVKDRPLAASTDGDRITEAPKVGTTIDVSRPS